MTRDEVLTALRTVHDLPRIRLRNGRPNHRTIYEWGDNRGRGTGRFGIDYATFAGGTAEEVPFSVIESLERDGLIVKAYPGAPNVKAWVLARSPQNEVKK